MSDRCLEILMNSDRKGNYIPSGRQLPRTPPYPDPTKQLDFESVANEEDLTFDLKTPPVRQVSSDDPQSMLKGMKGYQLTPVDLEFMQKMKEEKELKKLQDDLKELQKLLKNETMALEMADASKEKAQAELLQLPSCEEIREWSMVVLEVTAPSAEITQQDASSLLALVTKENAQKAIEEKKRELKELKKMVDKKKKNDAKERGQLEKQIAIEQSKIHGLMTKLSELKAELARQEEANKTLKTQAPEMKDEEGEDEEAEGVPAANRPVKPKQKKRPAKSEKLQDATNQSKSTKRATNRKNVVKDETNPSTTEKTKQLTKSVKGRQRKEESVPEESDVKGPRKAAGRVQSKDSQAKTQRKVKEVEPQPTSEPTAPTRGRKKAPVAAHEAAVEQNAGLRRSKRIASQK